LNILKGTVWKASGLKEKWNHNSILGITDTETVKLDFDNTPLKTVKYWASRTCRWFKLGGFIVLKSSENHYHVVFDSRVSWSENVSIMAWVCLLFYGKILAKLPLLRYFIMQCIKQSSTLRVSPKKDKLCPRVVFCNGKQEKQIHEFLSFRKLIKDIIRKMLKEKCLFD